MVGSLETPGQCAEFVLRNVEPASYELVHPDRSVEHVRERQLETRGGSYVPAEVPALESLTGVLDRLTVPERGMAQTDEAEQDVRERVLATSGAGLDLVRKGEAVLAPGVVVEGERPALEDVEEVPERGVLEVRALDREPGVVLGQDASRPDEPQEVDQDFVVVLRRRTRLDALDLGRREGQ